MPVTNPAIVVVGSNHEYAPVEIRERLAFTGEGLVAGLDQLRESVPEGMILSTCNRTELYAVGDSAAAVEERLFDFLQHYHSISRYDLRQAAYTRREKDAVQHIFRVASGLNSMILGEPQILTQIRDALDAAREREAVGPVLQRLALDALTIGKKARTLTDIARNNASIAHAAVDLAANELGTLDGKRVTIVGAGKMATLAAKLIRARGAAMILVVNRTLEKAQALAAQVEGEAIPIEEMRSALLASDLVVAAAIADGPMVRAGHVIDRDRDLVMVDVSVPRVIDHELETHPHVRVFDVDALQTFHSRIAAAYADEVLKVEDLVAVACADYDTWLESRQGTAAIAAIRSRGEQVQEVELSKALRKLGHLSERDQNVVRAMAVGLVNKMLHQPIQELRAISDPDERRRLLKALGISETDIT